MSEHYQTDRNNEIEELRERIRRHEVKILEFEQQRQEDREEKKRLENEVSELKKRMKFLEDEVRYFSTKQVITDLKSQLKEKDGEMNDWKKLCEEMRTSMMDEIRIFKEDRDNVKAQLGEYIRRTEKLEESQNMLFIGELCAELMEAVYRQVLPGYFERDDYKKPHLRVIDDKIKEYCQTKKDKRQAREKWKKLQAEIDEDLVEFMEEKLAERNKKAHPIPLNENKLKEIARNLPDPEQLHLEKVIRLSKEMTPGILIAS